MSDIAETSPMLCSGDDGCQETFPNKYTPGLCIKCLRIKNAVGADKERWACLQCGACSLQIKNPCGLCKSKLKSSDDTTTPTQVPASQSAGQSIPAPNIQELYHQNTSQWMANRVGSKKSIAAATPLTNANLGLLRASSASNLEYITVLAEPFNAETGKMCPILGNVDQPFLSNTPMDQVLEKIVSVLNIAWETRCTARLSIEDFNFRKFRNTVATIKSGISLVDYYKQNIADRTSLPTKYKLRKGTFVYFEAHLDNAKFESRTTVASPLAAKKRGQCSYTSGTADEQHAPKRVRSSVGPGTLLPLNSSFRIKGSAQPAMVSAAPSPLSTTAVFPPKSTSIRLMLADIRTTPEGIVSITWPSLDDLNPAYATIEDEPCNQGFTKFTYRLTQQDDLQNWIAKRYYNSEEGPVSPQKNDEQLKLEVTRLEQLRWHWNFFLTRQKMLGVKDEFHEFQVAPAVLAREVFNNTTKKPSPAAGIQQVDLNTESQQDDNVLNSDPDSGPAHVTWLLDIERSARVTRWSGSNEHPTHTTTVAGATINAFQHCSYLASNKTLIFADLQSSASWGGNSAPVLFDVMTHTIDSDSGIGDLGIKGIEKLVAQHECGPLCPKLQLANLKDESEDSDSDESD